MRHEAAIGGVFLALLLVAGATPAPAQDADEPLEVLPLLPGPSGDPGTDATAELRTLDPGAGTPRDLLVQGNALYENGRYEEAARAYRTALAYGLENEVLHYNLGNALFRQGRLGPAILEYERALLLAPGDEDIRANLEFARSRAPDVPPPPEEGPLAIVLRWLRRPGVNGAALAALAAYLVAAILAGVALVRRRGGTQLVWTLAGVALLLALPPALVVAVQGTAREADDRAVILADRVDCRSGPGETNPVLFTVHEGTTVRILDDRTGWSRVTLADGLNGWLPGGALERISPDS